MTEQEVGVIGVICGRGHGPRSADGLQKLEKTREWVLP